MAHRASRQRMVQMGRDRRGVLAWMVSTVGAAILVLSALTAFEAMQARRDRKARPDRSVDPVPLERMDHPVYQGPRAIPDRQVPRTHRAR